MGVMVVGADHLGTIQQKLEGFGFGSVSHVTGRSATDTRGIVITPATSLVIVMIDFVNHNLAKGIKKKAKQQGIPIIFGKRSWCSLEEKLLELSR